MAPPQRQFSHGYSYPSIIGSLDTRVGVMIGITAAAFGLVATNGGSAQRLFAEHRGLATAALYMLALVLVGLIGVVLVRNAIDYPGVPTLIRLANEPEARFEELSLDGLQRAWARNRRLIVWKARPLLAAQAVLVLFVLLVVAFQLPDLWRALVAVWHGLV